MFTSRYQGGKSIDLFSAQGKDPLSTLRIYGGHTVYKEFDANLKGYVVVLNGSPATTHIHIPKGERKTLGVVQPHLLLQILIPHDSRLIIEISVADTSNSKRRLQVSPSYKDHSTTPLLAKLPLSNISYDIWCWLSLDISSLLQFTYPVHHFQSIEGISINGNCKIRRIATLRDVPSDTGELPSSWHPPPSVTPLPLFIFDSSVYGEKQSRHSLSLKDQKLTTHIAFGEKVPIPKHLLKPKSTKTHSKERLIPKVSKIDEQRLISRPQSKKIETHSPIPVPKLTHHSKDILKHKVSKIEEPRPIVRPPSKKTEAHSPVPMPLIEGMNFRVPNKTQTQSSDKSETETPLSDTMKPNPKLLPDNIHRSFDSSSSPSNDLSRDEEMAISVLTHSPFSYQSPPHSAHKRKHKVSFGHPMVGREAGPDEDFVSVNSTHQNPIDPDESYKWENYQTLSSSSSDEENIDHTNLTHPQYPIPLSTAQNDDTLETSTTLGTLKERLKALQSPSLQDPLDISGMGGPSSPEATISMTTEQDEDEEEKIELIYDQDLNCFYDPNTGKYYELT